MIMKGRENVTNDRIIRGTKSVTNEICFISELQEGKREAIQQLFDNYYQPLCSYSYRIVEDRCLSEDIAAASFYKIWRRRNRFDDLNSLLAYLYTVTKNASLDQIAILKRRRTAHQQMAYLADQHEDIIQSKMIRRELLRSILDESETLSPKIKEVFALIYLDGLRLTDASEKLGVSLNTVKTQLSIALKKLRVVMQKKYSGLSCLVTQNGKYEEPEFEYGRPGVIVPWGNDPERREMVKSKKAFIDFRRFY
jgi:RNA polymerase sigma-70 factor (family 1)